MTAYNITNEGGGDHPKLDKSIISHIIDFKNKVVKNGLVSRHDVIALEEFIGNDVFTNTLSLNIFTSTESHMGITDIEDVVNAITKDVELDKVLTRDDIIRKCVKASVAVRDLLGYFKYVKDKFTFDDFTKFTESKIVNRYENGELISVLDLPITYVISNYTDYFTDLGYTIPDAIYNSDDTVFKMLSGIKQNNLNIYGMHNILLEQITVGDILKMLNDEGTIRKIEEFSKSINEMYSDIKYSDWEIYNYKDVIRYNKMLDEVINISKDTSSRNALMLFITKQ